MAIRVVRQGDGLRVAVTPPHHPAWESRTVLSPTEVLEALSELGCHSMDATDALDESGFDWRPVHDAEVMRRRAAQTS